MSVSNKPMRRNFSGIILVTEIAAIMILHAFRLNNHAKNEKPGKTEVVSQQPMVNTGTSYAFSKLR